MVREHRIASEHIDASVARWIQEPLRFEARKVGDGGAEKEVEVEDTARQWAPTAFTYILWISIFSGAQMLLTSTIEEKSARIMEVLVSSVSHFELMAGKVAGVAAAGLSVVASWGGFIFVAILVVPILLGAPSVGFIGQIVADPGFLLAFLVYFVLGYLLYASLLVGIGSVCTNIKDAQSLMMPIMIPMMIPIFAMVPVSQDPNGLFARIMSFIPPFTPFVMMNRSAGPPELWEYAATTLLLIGSIYLTMVGAGGRGESLPHRYSDDRKTAEDRRDYPLAEDRPGRESLDEGRETLTVREGRPIKAAGLAGDLSGARQQARYRRPRRWRPC